ncbi:arabinan endo-1,5-alpha-L-arabinosidase [Paradesertivirga mongoliensis]|uniref:Arabinan endo-1,5-alpha-L-arabinosidase n=1 Tax=Paradesertivirga mongoliensis TaxID=2100740 RepID=A0ABW4ZGK7_9SPHI|nr:arabinan endo-1,5-alpha-L-arabinosidase [Pedobacter mongoliensis]
MNLLKTSLIVFCFFFRNDLVAQQRKDSIIENNGLKGNLGVHDPVMIKRGDTYYVFGTGISVKTSKDKINWANAPGVFPRNPGLPWWKNDIPDHNGHIWAPDIHYRDGKYHLYYSVSAWMNFNSSIGYATNTTLDKNDPKYKWEDHGQVISFKNGGEGVNVIDPNIFVEKNGKVWLLYGSYKSGLRLVELNPKTGKLFDENPKLITLTSSLGEGVFLVKGPEYYYIFASRGRCCAGNESTYQIVMGRSKDIAGPYLNREGKSWVDNNYTVFLAGDEAEPGRGHNGIFAEGDTTYMVYHAYTRAHKGASLLNIKPLYMTGDDWPTLMPTPKLFAMDKFQKRVFIGDKK